MTEERGTEACPDYRVRLFLSADLIGSTAYKASEGGTRGSLSAHARWVDDWRRFYREFPAMFDATLSALEPGQGAPVVPQVWKTVGDEILFCVPLACADDLRRCVVAFIDAIRLYCAKLIENRIPLDLKGAAWTAVFPTSNVSVPTRPGVADESEFGLSTSEQIERSADEHPGSFEFLGPDMDGGFRVSDYAAANLFVLSAEAAYLLTQACCAISDPDIPFRYVGRLPLKGLISGRPYPLVAIDTERRRERRNVQALEAEMLQASHPTAFPIKQFLEAFLQDEGLELPVLPINRVSPGPELPLSYRDFRAAWIAEAREDLARKEVERQSADDTLPPPDPDPGSRAAIEEAFRATLRRLGRPNASE